MRRGEPSRTALGAAVHRAVHQDLEGGRVFRDDLAWRVLGEVDREQLLARARERPAALRLFIAVRHRFAEDGLAAAVGRGVDQAVVLGAGLDTFAYRNPHEHLHVVEVDHPDTGAWKQERLREAGLSASGAGVTYVGVDFERDDLITSLTAAGLDPGRPAYFLWLGVVPYLSETAVVETLRAIARVPGAEVVLDYPAPGAGDSAELREVRADLLRRTAAAGEPLRTTLDPGYVEAVLRDLGFTEVEDLGRAQMLPRYLATTTSPHQEPGSGGGAHVVRARRGSD